jgi:hypothetical protein
MHVLLRLHDIFESVAGILSMRKEPVKGEYSGNDARFTKYFVKTKRSQIQRPDSRLNPVRQPEPWGQGFGPVSDGSATHEPS